MVSVVELGLLIVISMCFSLPIDKKYQMKGSYVDINLKKLWNSLTASKNCDIKYKEIIDSKFVIKIYRRYFNLKKEKKNII